MHASYAFLIAFLISTQRGGYSFEFPKFPVNLGRPSSPKNAAGVLSKNVQETKKALIEAVSNTGNGKSATLEQQAKVLELVQKLESLASPSIKNILTDPKEAAKIDGVWYLQYTSPSILGDEDRFPDAWKPVNAQEGKSRIDTQPARRATGAVQAAGITVDTSNRVVQQIFNVATSRVQNKIDLGWGRVEVEGSFRPSEAVPNRAVVGFDRAEIVLDIGWKIDLGWFFTTVLPILNGGSRNNGWVETTYIDDEIRIGRGNKGTLFVITRSPDAVTP